MTEGSYSGFSKMEAERDGHEREFLKYERGDEMIVPLKTSAGLR